MAFQLFGRSRSVTKRSPKYLDEALYKKLFKDGSSEMSVRQQLNQFLKSRKRVFKWEVDDTLKKLRDRNLYSPAIKVKLLKSMGIPAAETYFIDLPESSKNHLCYGALLNCYCKELMTDEAEALMEKMKELSLPLSSMPYNSLMTLYEKTGKPEKISAIVQEMKASSMKRDGRAVSDWTTYSNLASIYVNAGLFKKAETALKELEKKNSHKDLSAFQFSNYIIWSNRKSLEVYRIWRSLRLAFPKTANGMGIMVLNLRYSYCNTIIGAYAKEGLLDKALELQEHARRRGAKPNVKTWEIFFDYYLKNGDFKSAVDCVTNAISTGRGNGKKWIPSDEIVNTLMQNFEQEKDVDGAEGFVEILKKVVDTLEVEVFESLIRTYAAAGRTSQAMRRRLKMENVEVGEASEKLLESICVE
ncbi:hypothetical protein F8388_008566 [Cannabis sativa]|uniref:Pentatricopeptide repeat-containing protein n=1 Tax=Cannabis sativa TaxID=3483 RepID=A0A7J6E694_CANSA|nr:hypothetical protein F8388_008566 [Cannabis sativa]